jgi:N-acylneuraminate cytidylyltransferase
MSAMPRASVPWPESVDLVVFDFDGVMTDNRVLVFPDGSEAVCCHRGDGLGIDRLRQAGVPMIVLSTEKNAVVAVRARKLQIPVVHGLSDKAEFLVEFLAERAIDPRRVAYIGNDVNDLDAMSLVGLPVAVADAVPEVRALAKWVLARKGGEGAVREFCDELLRSCPKHSRASKRSIS